MNVTREGWEEAWRELGASVPGGAVFARLIACYSEPHRHYHTLQHLRECFELFGPVRHLASHPAEIEMALWFHDAYYDVHRSDNELRSADLALQSLSDAGVDRAAAQRVHALVMATVHEAVPDEPDAKLMVDVDLSILGSPPARFQESDRQIRQEYGHVPWPEYREARMRVLQGFLSRPRLYSTPAFHDAYEARARANLQGELDRLAAASVEPVAAPTASSS
jgi:predicted metal-dependent HD superfamily phosphohydrolase